MMTFQEWLAQIGLAHCAAALVEHGIDFDVASELTDEHLRSCGLNLGDRLRFRKALSSRNRGSISSPATASRPVHSSNREARPSAGEQRQLTVMFCDLVGYTALTQRYDREVLKRTITEYRDLCSRVVDQYEGHVAQRLGDGLMIYFGWPRAHEDDAERCVRAALEIVPAVKGVGFSEPLAVHIGVATGQVLVGDPSTEGQGDDALAVGETPSLAERLQRLARSDQIVIGPTTRQLVGNAFDLEDLGVRRLKGILSPIHAWRVVSELKTEGRFDAAHRGTALTPLVGRDEEVAWLMRHWDWARGGEGQVVMLGGEAGIGKSRLTQVLRERLRSEPHATFLYQCSSFRQSSALYPIIQQVERGAAFSRDDAVEEKLDKLEAFFVGSPAQRAEAATLIAPLLSLPTDRYPPLSLSPQRHKEKIIEALVDQLAAVSRGKPLLLVFEDAHWIDPTSQELLDAIVPRIKTLPVLLVLTHRPTYGSRWREYSHVATVELPALPMHLAGELVREVAQRKSMPSEVLDKIVARADGIPMHLEELTKFLLESRLRDEGDRYVLLEPLAAPSIPPTLVDSLVARLARVGRARVSKLAQIGACIGREFPHDLLAAVSRYNADEFDEELEQLIGTGLAFRRGTAPDATYTFKHALVQDAAYNSLLPSERKQLHGTIAETLKTSFSERVVKEPEVVAHHYTEAGLLGEAIPLWRTAGEAALARVALQDGVSYLERGLALAEALPSSADRDRLELSLRGPLHTARLRWRGWAAADVQANATAILRLARDGGTRQNVLIGLFGSWISTITQGRVAEALTWAQQLVDEGEKTGDVDQQILGERACTSSHFYLGHLQEALTRGQRALALYDPGSASRWMELTGNDVRTAVGVFLSQCYWMLGYPDRAVHVSDQKDADSRSLGHPFDIGWATTWGAYVFDYRREPERLLERVDEAERHGREQRIPLFTNVLGPLGRGLAKLRVGELPDAIDLLSRGVDGWRMTGGHLNLPYLKAALAEAWARQGDFAAAMHLIDECLAQMEKPGWEEKVWKAETLRLKGWMLMHLGDLDEAETQLRAAITCAQQQQAKSWELRAATTLAELLAARGDRAAAHSVLAPIDGWFTEGLASHDLKEARHLLDSLA